MKWDFIKEDRVVEAYGIMARAHYLWHLHEVGADVVYRNGEVCHP
jgi:hypothetical protein